MGANLLHKVTSAKHFLCMAALLTPHRNLFSKVKPGFGETVRE